MNKIVKIICCTLLFAMPLSVAADDLDGGNGNGDVQDVPTAPISDYVPALLIAGTFLGFAIIKKRSQVIKG